jgi:hypothetical protein
MTRIGIVIASGVMAAAALTSPSVQAQVSEPAAFQAQNPNRDVLNGGQLTPAARAALGQSQYEGSRGAYASQAYAPAEVPITSSRRHRRHH